MYQSWIDLGLKKGLSDLQVYAVRNKSLKLTMYQQNVEQNVVSDIEVITIKGIYQGKASSIRFENLQTTNVSLLLDQLIENAKALTVSEPAIIFEGSPSYPHVEDSIFDFSTVPTEKKIAILQALEKGILDNPTTLQVQTTSYIENESQTVISNSKGLHLKRHHTFAYAYAIGVFGGGDDIQTAHHIGVYKTFDEVDVQKLVEKTIEKGNKKLGGKTVATDMYDVVFQNDMFAEILGVYAGIFSGEAAYRHLTKLEDKLGKQIAKKTIDLIDDPLSEKALFKSPFDDEGVACEKRYLIKEGVFQGFLHNLKTAAIMNTQPTGHGFQGGISPTNLYLKPSDLSLEDMLKPIAKGIFITDLVGLHAGVNDVSGDFSLQAAGFRIEAGVLTTPVKLIVVSGNFFDILNQIEAIANDFEFDLSGIGTASVHVGKLMVAGE